VQIAKSEKFRLKIGSKPVTIMRRSTMKLLNNRITIAYNYVIHENFIAKHPEQYIKGNRKQWVLQGNSQILQPTFCHATHK
jgi:hypothetical protein